MCGHQYELTSSQLITHHLNKERPQLGNSLGLGMLHHLLHLFVLPILPRPGRGAVRSRRR
jgi:hypothetical protein